MSAQNGDWFSDKIFEVSSPDSNHLYSISALANGSYVVLLLYAATREKFNATVSYQKHQELQFQKRKTLTTFNTFSSQLLFYNSYFRGFSFVFCFYPFFWWVVVFL